ncbi:MAG TPA: macro domain-containing protein [Bacteroidota bacterium]|nr:macro domain-containing protein [Bacteroidota bacterium]
MINKGTLEIVRGDIADQDTMAIVNAANNLFWMGSGVAGAIKRKGGAEIEREAVVQGPAEIGEAILTAGGSLKANYVIHAAVMGQDLHTNAEYIRKATQNTLRLAEQSRIESLSLPAFGTGVGGFSIYHCASIMLGEAVAFLSTSHLLRQIRFVLFEEEAYDVFQEELRMQFSAKRHT